VCLVGNLLARKKKVVSCRVKNKRFPDLVTSSLVESIVELYEKDLGSAKSDADVFLHSYNNKLEGTQKEKITLFFCKEWVSGLLWA
jgi:hypothetical protein